jgi:hypothetical protein
MRASRYAIALVAAVLIGFGVKLYFAAPIAVAQVAPGATIDPSAIQRHITDLPVHKFHDMSFVFSAPN